MSKNIFISVTTKDKVGIIATITKTVETMEGDLTGLSQTVLNGYFTMILISEFSDNINCTVLNNKLEEEFSKLMQDDKFKIITWEIEEANNTLTEKDSNSSIYILTANANNRKGLIAEISSFCRNSNINIINLCSDLKDDQYTMIFYIEIKSGMNISKLRSQLDLFSQQKQLHIMLQHYDIFKATNEI